LTTSHDPPCQPIRVLIVDDHVDVRKAIATVISAIEDLELAGEASAGEAALQICARTRPDVVLMDATLADMTGSAATREFRHRWPLLPIIAMCTFQEEPAVADLLQAGAAGYLLKNVSAQQLAETIRTAHEGRALMPDPARESWPSIR
jgi:NarL family two-component system response regulator LiaR